MKKTNPNKTAANTQRNAAAKSSGLIHEPQSKQIKTEKKGGSKTPDAEEDPIFQKYGSPFLVSETNKVTLNDRAVAVKCATMHQVRYDTNKQHHERYDATRGLWVRVHQVEVERMLDDLLLELGQTYEHQDFVACLTASKLSSLSKMMRPHTVTFECKDIKYLIHVTNGIVDLSASKPKLLAHDPAYAFHASSAIQFNPKAECPTFLKKFLEPALEVEDMSVVQKYCGSMLLGPNTSHGLMVIRGTPGGGKSTLVTLMEKVIGEHNVAHLRTAHLGGRFETSAFLGKRLLVGKDVPGDTLAVSGARMLKSLVGGDLMQAERKYDPDKKPVRGDFHVIIVSNNKLQIALDGDEDAWRRRLLVVDFKNPKPSQPIPHFAEKLFIQEASGILNWLIEGAKAFKAEMEKHGFLILTEEQKGRVDSLLEDSDNLPVFINKCLSSRKGSDVTSEELLLGYYRVCKTENWTPISSHKFQTRVPELLAQLFSTTRRNDIQRHGKAARGFKNVALEP